MKKIIVIILIIVMAVFVIYTKKNTRLETQRLLNTISGYSIDYPASYHVAFQNNLVNYDENKYENGKADGVKIQIQPLEGKYPASKEAKVIFSERRSEGPGGTFDLYRVSEQDGRDHFQILVWGAENDKDNINKILSTFEFLDCSNPRACMAFR